MPINELVEIWESLTVTVQTEFTSHAEEEKTEHIRQMGFAWLVHIYHDSRSSDAHPFTPLKTTEYAFDVIANMREWLGQLENCVGVYFNEKQFESFFDRPPK